MTTTRIKLILAYDGTDFAGWQRQRRGVRSVQAEVEAAIAKIVGGHVHVQGAGRTDSGVHARGQCAHADIPEPFAGRVPWQVALNCILARDVRVVAACVAPPDFHAQFRATSKIYAYTLWHERGYVDPMRRRFVWDVPPLDEAAMDEAAAILVGRHDFNSFRNLGSPVGPRGTVRTLMGLWREPGSCPAETVWRARADGFLKQMVRNLVGCLVAVGKGKATPQDVRLVLEQCDRNHKLPTAPPHGLCMERVFYPGDPDDARAPGFAAPARAAAPAGEEADHDRRDAGSGGSGALGQP
ncbi:MAG: tRNA pseudouridine(38-40) synthase TruA [Desulfovibrionaceae bacterium CG1_02_65_16]|nr:MAG: tRNA pseudouridine(38-40) synthase TruA [Desulfovibrionaceae bacterium CG1_02_65_16]